MEYVVSTCHDGVFHITLKNPEKRNALSIAMFDAIDESLERVNDKTRCVLICGEGPVFCAGFDMKACAEDLSIVKEYINRLSLLIRLLRRINVPVVVAAHGAAIAGGCAVLTGCDFVVGSAEGKYGYPVHQLGISPAVTIPTLFQKLGEGRARALVMSSEIMSGTKAFEIGLLTHVEERSEDVQTKARELACVLAEKPPNALQATKKWLNELDGSLDDKQFDLTASHSSSAIGDETREMLEQIWKQ